MTTSKAIVSFLKAHGRKGPVCAKQLLHLGSREAVDQALSRLARRKQLVRVTRGFYALPVETRFGSLPPEPGEAIEAIARSKGERISPAGASAANAMGLTTQVPVRRVYVTSGRSRRIKLSGETVELRHGAPLAENSRHERLLRAIEWLGPEGAAQAKAMLNSLPLKERRKLAERAALMPAWMAEAVSEAAYGDERFSLSEPDRRAFLQAAATAISRTSVLVEKDIWVVWALRALFEAPFGQYLVFKGGTSLSKAYRLIERFSEDVDITYDIRQLAPDLLPKGWEGMDEPLPANPSQVKKLTDAIRKERLPAWVKYVAAPAIEARLKKDGAKADVIIEGANLSVRYAKEDHGGVKSAVLLEFGARSTGEPASPHNVVCDAVAAKLEVDLPTAKPRVMSAQRTFWEKATAVHTFCKGKDAVGDHLARHWYDIERLDVKGIADTAIADKALADRVARHKGVFFREKDAAGAEIDYGAVVKGSLQLKPTGDHLEELKKDYAAMTRDGLLPENALSFADLMTRCASIEAKINAATKPKQQ